MGGQEHSSVARSQSDLDELVAQVHELGGRVIDQRLRTDRGHAIPLLLLSSSAEQRGPEAVPSTAWGNASGSAQRVTLVRQGDFWTLDHGPGVVHLRHRKGLERLVALLANPGEEIDALALASGSVGARGAAAPFIAASCDGSGTVAPALDRQAKASYQARVERLRGQMARASGAEACDHVAGIQRELAFLEQELRRAEALHGRDRPIASNRERARVNVTRALRAAIAAVAAAEPRIGGHLDRSVATGYSCSYRPGRDEAGIVWELRSVPGLRLAP